VQDQVIARKGPRGDSVDKAMPCDPGFAHRAKHHRAIKRAKKPASEMVICTAERGKEAQSEQPYVGVAMRVGAASFIREPFDEAARAA
jgi:hypothetical protein